MGIIDELDKMVIREDDLEDIEPREDDVEEVEDDDAGVDNILKHIENVQKAAMYIDGLTTKGAGDIAFEAEVALRKALQKMQDLSKDVYKSKAKAEKT